jgi:predicted TPR repeat methyltransferase
MTTRRPSRDPAHFQRLYDADPDPWRFRTSDYEQAKYNKTMEALGTRRFRHAFEVGCSIGVMTRMLASRCDQLLAVDIIEQPLAIAQAACTDQPWVRFKRMHVPGEWPGEMFDLIVLSEVLYFLSADDIAAVADRTSASLKTNGLVLLVNWRAESGDPCTGDQAADTFMAHAQRFLRPMTRYREDRYRLDLLVRQ